MGTLISAYQWKQPERPVPNDTMDANWMMDAPNISHSSFPTSLKKPGGSIVGFVPTISNATFLLCDWSKMRFLSSFTVYFHRVFAILSPSIKFWLDDHFSWSGEIEFYMTLLVNCWTVWIIWRQMMLLFDKKKKKSKRKYFRMVYGNESFRMIEKFDKSEKMEIWCSFFFMKSILIAWYRVFSSL